MCRYQCHPSQLILLSHDRLAQYSQGFGYISHWQRVDLTGLKMDRMDLEVASTTDRRRVLRGTYCPHWKVITRVGTPMSSSLMPISFLPELEMCDPFAWGK